MAIAGACVLLGCLHLGYSFIPCTSYGDPHGPVDQPTVPNECRYHFPRRDGKMGNLILFNGIRYEFNYHQLRSFQLLLAGIKIC